MALITSKTLVEASGGGDYYWESDLLYLFDCSLAVVEVAVFSVAVVKVAVLLIVVVKVACFLGDVNVKVDCFLKDVDVKVAFLLEEVRLVARRL